MSQYWRGHWTDDAFTSKRLRNWEVPKWYPSLPSRHCVTTKFIADNNGHVLDDAKKDKHSPWGTYKFYMRCVKIVIKKYCKGTWDFPKKITRSIAKELSMIPQYKKDSWELYVKKHQKLCKTVEEIKIKEKAKIIESSEDTAKRDKIDKQSRIFIEKDGKDLKSMA